MRDLLPELEMLYSAMAGVRHRLDLFGVLVLSFAAVNGGDVTRDLLIGAVPPAAISDWRYLAVSLLAASAIRLYRLSQRVGVAIANLLGT